MLTGISWTDYFIVVGIALVIYYAFVSVKYYSGEIKDLLSGKRKLQFKPVPSAQSQRQYEKDVDQVQQEEGGGFEETTDSEFAEVEHLIERLKQVIEDASRRKLIPEEFKQYLAMLLKEYPSVKQSPLRSSINELIISECQKYGTVTISEDEVELLW